MWLPEPLYEAMPKFSITVGGIMLGLSLYIGISHWLVPYCLMAAFICIAYGTTIGILRARNRYNRPVSVPVPLMDTIRSPQP